MLTRAVARIAALVLAATTPAAAPVAARRGVPGFRPAPVVQCVSRHGATPPDWFTVRLLDAAGFPRSVQHDVCLIAGCESRFQPDEVRPNTRGRAVYGLMQIMANSHPWSDILAEHGWTANDLLDPLKNLTVAHDGWVRLGRFGGGGGWSCAGLMGVW